MPECYFFILYEHGSGLEDKSFALVTFSDSKLVMHMTNSVVFSVHSAVFSEECCMEKIELLFV